VIEGGRGHAFDFDGSGTSAPESPVNPEKRERCAILGCGTAVPLG
jgi:hypothetical protein